MLENGLLIFSGITLLTLCLLILVSNPKKAVNRALASFLISGFLWLIANFLTNIASEPSNALFFARLSIIGAALLPYTFLIFTMTYTETKKITKQHIIALGILPAIIIITSPTALNVREIGANGSGIITGPVYYLLNATLITYFSLGFYTLWRYYKETKSSVHKAQLRYMFLGLILTIVPGIVMNGILPLFGYDRAAYYGPNTVVIISVFLTLAIVKHRFLDIRLLVARSLAYILSLGLITVAFSVLLFGLSGTVNTNDESSEAQRILYVAVTVALVLTYPYLKRFFDKVTNKLFYRDAYDPQAFSSALNDILVTNIKLDSLLKQTSGLIVSNIKTESCLFVINTHQDIPERFIGSFGKNLTREDLEKLRVLTVDKNTKPIITDELPQGDPLRHLLRGYNVGCISHLMSIKGSAKASVGILLMGDKSSGNPYNHQDVKTLEIVANELVIAIQNALRFEEIEKFNVTLQQKVDTATRELRVTNEKLRALDETKDEFISMASHQLRTPLTAVKGYLSMVIEGDAGKVDENQMPMLNQAFNSAQRMVYLIADLLNVSRLKTGKFVIESRPTQLADVVEGELAQLTATAKAHNLHLVYNKPPNFPVLNLDETKIRQVIMNFVDNAIYYTPTGGTVTIELKDLGPSVQLTVTDTGIGVPKAAQPHLFGKFYRADNAQKARPDGTGLGLFMARKVVAAQGGSIVFKSEENKGSTFGFSFPKARLQAGTPAPPAKISTTV